MTVVVAERVFEEAIECALLRNGPDACSAEAAREPAPSYGDGPVPGGYRRRRPQDYDRTLCLLPSDVVEDAGAVMDTISSPQPDPERQAYARELHRVLEQAVDTLPETYRTVFMLRDVEGLSTSETGEGLGLGEEAVKTRLHRARAMIRRAVTARIGDVAAGAFQFHAPRCDRIVAAVLARISQ